MKPKKEEKKGNNLHTKRCKIFCPSKVDEAKDSQQTGKEEGVVWSKELKKISKKGVSGVRWNVQVDGVQEE
jgi:hypothetical protein